MKSEFWATGINLEQPPNLTLVTYKRGCFLIIYQLNLNNNTAKFLLLGSLQWYCSTPFQPLHNILISNRHGSTTYDWIPIKSTVYSNGLWTLGSTSTLISNYYFGSWLLVSSTLLLQSPSKGHIHRNIQLNCYILAISKLVV